jgi:hypothetical protein
VLTALATLLTVTGHLVGGGTVLGLSPFVVLVPMLAAVIVGLAQRCRGLVRVVGVLAGGQAALHCLLVVLTAHDQHVGSAAVSGTAMLAAHAVVTLIVALSVCHADAAISALVGALLKVLPRRLQVPPVDVPLPARPVPEADVPLHASVGLLAAHARRGPPTAG